MMGVEIDEMDAMFNPHNINNALRKEDYEYLKRLKEEMKKQPFIVNTSDMKERKYENTLYYILGVIGNGNKEGLSSMELKLIREKIEDVLEDNEEKPQTLIRG